MKKNGIMTLALALVLGLSVSAQPQLQQKRGVKGQKNQNNCVRQADKPMATAQARVDWMAKELKLTDAEKAKVQALLEKQDLARKQRQVELKKQREEMLAKFKNERKMQEMELEKIIGGEKFKQLQALKIERLQKAVKNRNHGKWAKDGRGRQGNQKPQTPNI